MSGLQVPRAVCAALLALDWESLRKRLHFEAFNVRTLTMIREAICRSEYVCVSTNARYALTRRLQPHGCCSRCIIHLEDDCEYNVQLETTASAPGAHQRVTGHQETHPGSQKHPSPFYACTTEIRTCSQSFIVLCNLCSH